MRRGQEEEGEEKRVTERRMAECIMAKKVNLYGLPLKARADG